MSASESEDADTLGEIVQEVAYVISDETNCNICHAEFLDSEDLKEHMLQVHRGSSKCQFCEMSYTGLESYAIHIARQHWTQLKSCRYCTKFFIYRDELRVHEKKHERQKAFGCSQCPLLFPQSREVELHEKLKHDNENNGLFLKCMIELIAYLKLYPPTFLLSDEKHSRMLECQVCSFTTFDMPTYLQHLSEEKCEAFVCNDCGKIFKNKCRLPHHFSRKRKCTDIKYYTYDTCPNCLDEYPRMTMDSHKQTCKIMFKCKRCNLTFNSIDELSSHQSQHHPLEVDIIKCKYCGKEFLSEKILNKHIDRSHKPHFHQYKYECKICTEAYFKHPLNLFRHYFTKHKDFAPYTCRVCDKQFRIRKKFTFHIKLDHKSIGFVEFDDQYNVFFSDKKSENPFIPKCVIPNVDLTEIPKPAESDETENEGKKKKKSKKSRRSDTVLSTSEDEDTEPLLVVKKRVQRKNKKNAQSVQSRSKRADMKNRRQFTCNVCGKYCYTYQNYHNHIKLHTKHQDIDCIKCSRSFSNKDDLNKHIATDHATSKLIETLKSVLERKQSDIINPNSSNTSNTIPVSNKTDPDENSSQSFAKTIKKVKIDKAVTPASIVPSDNISAKKFIENFMPDINEKEPKESVTISLHDSPFYRVSSIKLHKFVPEKMPTEIKLRMPEPFKEDNEPKVKVKVKMVQVPVKSKVEMEDYGDSFQDDDYTKNESIPEVAQEVMLEGSDEPPKILQMPQKIVIPKLPAGYEDIRIATLTPQAPFFKIIKVKAVKDEPLIIDTSVGNVEPEPKPQQDENIRLCDGTKLVSANPLAHLLGEKQLEDMMGPSKKKYYKPALHNVKGLIAEALDNIDKPSPKRHRKK